MVHYIILVLLFAQMSFGAALIPNGSVTSAKILDGTIVSGDISAIAAIPYSKLSLTGAIISGDLSAGAVTNASRAALGQQVSSSSGVVGITSATLVDITNLTVTITTTGRPITIMLVPDGTVGSSSGALSASDFSLALLRGGTEIARWGNLGIAAMRPLDGLFIDVVAAGTYTYKYQAAVGAGTLNIYRLKLIAYEL
jgi:hypothetical protein